jgi:hypothetical protein
LLFSCSATESQLYTGSPKVLSVTNSWHFTGSKAVERPSSAGPTSSQALKIEKEGSASVGTASAKLNSAKGQKNAKK